MVDVETWAARSNSPWIHISSDENDDESVTRAAHRDSPNSDFRAMIVLCCCARLEINCEETVKWSEHSLLHSSLPSPETNVGLTA